MGNRLCCKNRDKPSRCIEQTHQNHQQTNSRVYRETIPHAPSRYSPLIRAANNLQRTPAVVEINSKGIHQSTVHGRGTRTRCPTPGPVEKNINENNVPEKVTRPAQVKTPLLQSNKNLKPNYQSISSDVTRQSLTLESAKNVSQTLDQTRYPKTPILMKLHKYKEEEPANVLLFLEHSKIEEMLDLERDVETVGLALSVLANALKCESLPKISKNILGKLPNSILLTSGVTYILQREENTKKLSLVIFDILFILLNLFAKIPESRRNQHHVLSLILQKIQSLKKTSDVIDNTVVSLFNQVVNLTKVKVKAEEKLVTRTERVNLEDADPPNDCRQIAKVKVKAEEKLVTRTERVNLEDADPPNDYRQISLLPTLNDLNPKIKPFLRENKIKGKYDNVNHYLDVQFRLLREDFIETLRNGLANYQCRVDQGGGQDVYIYTGVSVVRPICSRMELLYRLEFDVTELGDIDWDTSKRLTYGSLVCLSSNYFQTFYNATVINRDQQLIKEGKIDVRFEHDLDDLFAMDGDKPFVMVENRAFYEAYRHVLGGLQNVKILPFEKYIVHCQNHVDPPIYIRQGRGRVFDLRPLIDDDIVLQKTCSFSRKSGCAAAVNVLDPHAWPPPELLNLNESQFRALQTALTKEFCMIQGPPGTGKTRVGLRIVKALLHNSKNWEAPGVPTRPMLIICYTNHALDQFLAGIAGFYDGQIVRVGNRITNEKLEKYSLKAWKDRGRKEGRYKNLGRESYNHGRNTEYYQNIIERASHNVDPEGDDIICEDNLYQIMLPRHRTQLQQAYCSGDSVIMEWLGLSKVTENKDNDFRLSRKQKKTSRQQRKSNIRMAEEDVNDVDNIFAIDTKSRWQLYRYWVSKARTKVRQNVTHQCKEYLESCTAQKGVMLMKEKLILSEASVIAMTTTGAAKYQHILQEINPRIIVIEEAAEVLEGHVIAALSEQCEHLILIGDHKQLRPNPNVHRLAKEFNLEISLFERMVDNGVHCDCLELQHRMRPEISKLLKPIYPKLVDHQSVCGRQDVKGMANNVFFINHYNKEDHDAETKSRSNVYEARFLVGLTDYLLKQGYGTHEITILATYSSQKQQLGRLMSDDQFKGITVTSVDNYQGEENEIVILSLVRNNKERDVGFLKTDNRVCVALSRAKKGLYVMGNFDILRHKSPLWNEIITTLERHGEIGQTLVLKCPNHPKGKGIKINTPDDFDKAASGGCQKICKSRLDCGHACELQCHLIDLEHRDYTCRKPCPKTCEEGHRCHLMCFQGCKKCQVSVSKFISRCGHYDQVPCHRPPAQHKCRFPCEKMLSCGHQCGNLCGFDHKCNICYV